MSKTEQNIVLLHNLLAYIHRDGGHHECAVGTRQAYDDAVNVLMEWRTAYDEQQRLKDDPLKTVLLLNLLGYLHNDDGSHARDVGIVQAYDEAVNIIEQLIDAYAELQRLKNERH